MKNLKEIVESKIKEKGYTKELIYSNLGMSRVGFGKAYRDFKNSGFIPKK